MLDLKQDIFLKQLKTPSGVNAICQALWKH
jgi:hypothetical protein